MGNHKNGDSFFHDLLCLCFWSVSIGYHHFCCFGCSPLSLRVGAVGWEWIRWLLCMLFFAIIGGLVWLLVATPVHVFACPLLHGFDGFLVDRVRLSYSDWL